MQAAIVTCGASSSPLVSNGTKKLLMTGYAICALFPASASFIRTDCCTACEPTRILAQLVFSVRSDDDRRKLLELGPTLKLDDVLKT
jgi:hypothetical protein